MLNKAKKAAKMRAAIEAECTRLRGDPAPKSSDAAVVSYRARKALALYLEDATDDSLAHMYDAATGGAK